MNRLVFLDRDGRPVERIKGRPVLNFFRLLIHTRRVVSAKRLMMENERSLHATCQPWECFGPSHEARR